MSKYYYGLLFSLLACLLLSLLFCPPFDLGISDKEFFTYTGWAVSRGQIPYRDFFDHKPPLIYLVNYIGVLTGGPWGLWLVNTTLAMVVTASFFNCCHRHRLLYPWLLPLLLNLMIRDPLINEGINMTREYTSWFLILFFCTLMSEHRYRDLKMGVLTGLIFFMQQDQVLPLIPLLAYTLLSRDASPSKSSLASHTPSSKSIQSSQAALPSSKRILSIGAGFLFIAIPIIIYFACHNSLGEFWRDAFLFNLDVYTAQKKSIGDHFRSIKRIIDAGNYEVPFMVATILGLVALTTTKKRPLIIAAIACLILCFSAEFMGGRYKDHQLGADYLYYLLPVSAGVPILLFTVFAYAGEVVPPLPAARLPFALLLCASLGYTALQHATHLQRRDKDPVINSPELNYLRQHRPANYQLYVFHKDDFIEGYYECRILSPSRWVYQHFWTWYEDWDPGGNKLQSITDDLQKHHTQYVIMDPADSAAIRNPANRRLWNAFMTNHYSEMALPGVKTSRLWQRKD